MLSLPNCAVVKKIFLNIVVGGFDKIITVLGIPATRSSLLITESPNSLYCYSNVVTSYNKMKSWKNGSLYNCKKCWKIQKGATIRRKSTQWSKEKRTNNDLQNTTQKTKDRVTRTLLKQRDAELMCSGRVRSSYKLCILFCML